MLLAMARTIDNDEPGVQDCWQPAEEEKDDVDYEVQSAAGAQEYHKRWDEDGNYA